jgi:hypothetical protein
MVAVFVRNENGFDGRKFKVTRCQMPAQRPVTAPDINQNAVFMTADKRRIRSTRAAQRRNNHTRIAWFAAHLHTINLRQSHANFLS